MLAIIKRNITYYLDPFIMNVPQNKEIVQTLKIFTKLLVVEMRQLRH